MEKESQKKKKRILHGLSEVAGQNSYSVQGLRYWGEKAECVIYYRNPFQYPFDICLNIKQGNKKAYPWYALKMLFFLVKALFRYRIFHFHYGRSILVNYELPLYSLLGKKVFYEFHGSDLRDYSRLADSRGALLFQKEKPSRSLKKRNDKIARRAQGIILHDDELIPFLPEGHAPVNVVPLRVDISRFTPSYPRAETERIRIVHAPSHRGVKGSEYVLKAFEELNKRYDNIEFVLVEGKTQEEAFKLYQTADIVVDQLLIGTYGVFAIECMAMGKPVITYIKDEMRDKLPGELPIVSADIHTIGEVLEQLIRDGTLRREKGIAGRKYAEDYHDNRFGAGVLRDIYYGRAEALTGREAFARVKRIKEAETAEKDGR